MDLLRIDTQKAYLEIRKRIVTLQMAPGAMIDEAQLAQELGLEITPIREALRLLAHENLVEANQRGLYVSEISWEDLKELGELRVLLEPFSACKAAERASPDDLAVLEALGVEHGRIEPGELERLLEVDHKFHQAIAAAAGNRYLERALEQLFGRSQRFWYSVLPQLKGLAEAVDAHQDLLAAIKQGDGEAAARIMRTHVEEFLEQSLEVMPRDAPRNPSG